MVTGPSFMCWFPLVPIRDSADMTINSLIEVRKCAMRIVHDAWDLSKNTLVNQRFYKRKCLKEELFMFQWLKILAIALVYFCIFMFLRTHRIVYIECVRATHSYMFPTQYTQYIRNYIRFPNTSTLDKNGISALGHWNRTISSWTCTHSHRTGTCSLSWTEALVLSLPIGQLSKHFNNMMGLHVVEMFW